MKIEDIERQAKDANMTGLYLNTLRAIYASVQLKNKENGGKMNDTTCVSEAINRFERAWALEERMPVARASTDVLLVQLLKDEIATAAMAKLVDPPKER